MEENSTTSSPKKDPVSTPKGGGWGGWGIPSFSVLSDLQKAASVAAEEISKNAVAVAKNAAKGIAEIQNVGSDVEPVKEGEEEEKSVDGEEVETDEDKRRKSALDKLEKASDDSMFGQVAGSRLELVRVQMALEPRVLQLVVSVMSYRRRA